MVSLDWSIGRGTEGCYRIGRRKQGGLLLTVKRSPPPGEITGRNGARVTILASDKATGHSLGVDLAIVDEAGLLDESKRDLWTAVVTSISGRNGPIDRNQHPGRRADVQ